MISQMINRRSSAFFMFGLGIAILASPHPEHMLLPPVVHAGIGVFFLTVGSVMLGEVFSKP